MITLSEAHSAPDLATVRALFQEYADTLGVDLGFQGFDEELRTLPGPYAPPLGTLLFASQAGRALGCVAVRPLGPALAEMKRLYVRAEGRGQGLGRILALAAIDHARSARYRGLRLDTMPQMTQAHGLYESLGFVPIAPYRHNPVPGTTFLELSLAPPAP